jgi:CHAD domain-containing protein
MADDKTVLGGETEKSAAEVLYPEMKAGEQQENPQVSSLGAEALFPEMSDEENLKDLTPEDHQSMQGMFELLEQESYQELGDKVEAELRVLGLSEEDLAPELELLGYARKYITDSPEWQRWTKRAIQNLHRARAFYRKKRE